MKPDQSTPSFSSPDADPSQFWGWDGQEVIPNPQAQPMHLGLMVGDGIFETIELVGGEPFALRRHLERLEISAQRVNLSLPEHRVLMDVIGQAVAAAPATHRRLRITVTSTGSQLTPARSATPPLLVVATGPSPAAKEHAKVITVPWVRNERGRLAGVKSTSYQENMLISAHARENGADEALLANTVGELCEGTSSNVIVDLNGTLITPALSAGCLAGVTRDLSMLWGAQAGLEIREATPGELPYSLLLAPAANGIRGIALAGTLRGIQPVSHVDEHVLATSPLLMELKELFTRNLTEGRIDP